MPKPIQPPAVHCSYRLAINVEDVARLSPTMKQGLLAGRLHIRESNYIKIDKSDKPEAALEFSCQILEAATVCDVIRDSDRRAGNDVTRVYVLRESSWSRLPATAVLTTMANGRCDLSRDLFRVEVSAAAPVGIDDHDEPDDELRLSKEDVSDIRKLVAGNQQWSADTMKKVADDPTWDEPEPVNSWDSDLAPDAPDEPLAFGSTEVKIDDTANLSWYQEIGELPGPNGKPIKGSKIKLVKAEPVALLEPRKKVAVGQTYPPVAKTFAQHYERWRACQRCPLGCQRSQVVLARGQMPCDVLLVGEAPGESEDAFGVPFYGPAGSLLDQIVSRGLADYPSTTTAFANVVACFPRNAKKTSSHEPLPDEIKACSERLQELVRLCNPRLVVTVGALAEKWFPWSVPWYNGSRINVTHPAAILRQPIIQQGLSAQRAVVTIASALRRLNEAGV